LAVSDGGYHELQMNKTPHAKIRFERFMLMAGLSIVILSGYAFADSTGTITGKIVIAKTGLPPLDAKVTIVELNRQVPVYPYDGKYIIQDVPPGFYSLKIECDYYETANVECIEVDSNLYITRNIVLNRSPKVFSMLKPGSYQFYTNDMKDARPIISLCWRLYYQHQNKTVGELISIYAR
jgi:hypothetical protein